MMRPWNREILVDLGDHGVNDRLAAALRMTCRRWPGRRIIRADFEPPLDEPARCGMKVGV